MYQLLISLAAICTAFSQPSMNSLPVMGDLPVNKVIEGVPEDLEESTLLIPRYDLFDMDEAIGKRRDFVINYNKAAKRNNTTINDMVKKSYPFEYKLVGLKDVEGYQQEETYRYYMDMVLMPKQMTQVKKEAMVPSFIKFNNLNKMLSNRNSQFRYYWYIRDLKTDDAYITTRLQGQKEEYAGMGKFLKIVTKDVKE